MHKKPIKETNEYDSIVSVIKRSGKSGQSIKNIISGLTTMINTGLIEPINIQEQFSPTNFPQLRKEVKIYLESKNKKSSWLSFLNDIFKACGKIGGYNITTLNFNESLYVLCKEKWGGDISKSSAAKKLSESLNDDSSYPLLFNWISGVITKTHAKNHPLIQQIDTLFNCHSQLISKLPKPIIRLKKSSPRKSCGIPWSDDFSQSLERFLSWRKDNIITGENFYYPNIKGERIPNAVGTSWQTKPNGSCGTCKTFTSYLNGVKNFLFETNFKKIEHFQFVDLFEANFLDAYVGWNINAGVYTSPLKFIYNLRPECKASSYTHLFSGSDKYKSRKKWLENLVFIRDIIDEHVLRLKLLKQKSTKAAVGGKSNITFLLDDEDIKEKTLKISDRLRKFTIADNTVSIKKQIGAFQVSILWDTSLVRPMRIENNVDLKWMGVLTNNEIIAVKQINECCIFKSQETNLYSIFVPKKLMKNQKSKKCESIFQSYSKLTKQIDSYVLLSESFCSQNNVKFVSFFYCVEGGNVSNIGDKISKTSLYTKFRNLTEQATMELFEIPMAINPQAMRHLIATIYLMDNHKDYVGLATLLMDDLITILNEYAKMDHSGNTKMNTEWSDNWISN